MRRARKHSSHILYIYPVIKDNRNMHLCISPDTLITTTPNTTITTRPQPPPTRDKLACEQNRDIG